MTLSKDRGSVSAVVQVFPPQGSDSQPAGFRLGLWSLWALPAGSGTSGMTELNRYLFSVQASSLVCLQTFFGSETPYLFTHFLPVILLSSQGLSLVCAHVERDGTLSCLL